MVAWSPSFLRPERLMSGMALGSRVLVVVLAAGSVLGSAAVILRGPPRLRTPHVRLPGFTAEEAAGHLVVTSVRDGSGAARAGLTPGDVVETIDGRRFDRLQDAARFLKRHPRGPVRVGLVHSARYHDVTLRQADHRNGL